MRSLFTILCGTLVIMTAPHPVFAISLGDLEFNGFIRSRAIMADYSLGKNRDPDQVVDNRFRGKLTWNVNKYLSGVYHGEVDFQWGDATKTNGRNQGGGLGGDTVNLETKNIYIDVRVPDYNFSSRLGLQTLIDNLHQQVILGDAAGVRLDKKWDATNVTLGWFKLDEGEEDEGGGNNDFPTHANDSDDVDMWMAQIGYARDPNLKVGFDAYYLKNGGTGLQVNGPPVSEIGRTLVALADGRTIPFAEEDTFLMGPHFSWRLQDVVLSGYAAYNFGTAEDAILLDGTRTDVDISAYNLGLKAEYKLGSFGSSVEGFYWSSDDDLSDDRQTFYHTPQWSINSSASSVIPSGREGLMILLGDIYSTTWPAGPGGRSITGLAHSDGGFTGFGMTGIVVNGQYSPKVNKNIYVRTALGYFMTLEDELKLTETESITREGKTMGTEVAVRIGYKYAKNLDLSFNGAYAFLGDFYDNTASQTGPNGPSASPYYSSNPADDDPDNPFVMYLMAQLSW